MRSGKNTLRKVLYVAMRYDYGRPEQGTSVEYNSFYRTLVRMVPEVVEFDFMSVMQQDGKAAMNRKLLEMAQMHQPDLIFFCLFTDEIEQATIGELTKRFVTFNWFCDDHWRFWNFSRHYAPHFSFVSTTDPDAVTKYERIGYRNALLTQWACNHRDYVSMPDALPRRDVTFVGQPHGNRKAIVKFLEWNGITIQTFGNGWPQGRISQEEMIRIFNESRINLNLSNSSWNIHTLFRGRQQIKARNFEIPGCGGFLLTNRVEHLERYYRIGEEVACFTGTRDLLRKIRYFLEHEDERKGIARRGYERTLRDHTYEHRFNELFAAMGFAL